MSRLTAYDKFIQQALKYAFSLFGLPKSGQTVSFTPNDDGSTRAGYPKSGPQFVLNGDGTVTDLGTGLMWVRDPFTSLGSPFTEQRTWEEAIGDCEILSFAGYSDWRLPNIKELLSIVDYNKTFFAFDFVFFRCIFEFYRSSTISVGNTSVTWVVAAFYGSTAFIGVDTPMGGVFPVRAGAVTP